MRKFHIHTKLKILYTSFLLDRREIARDERVIFSIVYWSGNSENKHVAYDNNR